MIAVSKLEENKYDWNLEIERTRERERTLTNVDEELN